MIEYRPHLSEQWYRPVLCTTSNYQRAGFLSRFNSRRAGSMIPFQHSPYLHKFRTNSHNPAHRPVRREYSALPGCNQRLVYNAQPETSLTPIFNAFSISLSCCMVRYLFQSNSFIIDISIRPNRKVRLGRRVLLLS